MTSLPIRRLFFVAGLAAAFAAQAARLVPGTNAVSGVSGVIRQVQASGAGWAVTLDNGLTYAVPQSALQGSGIVLQPGQPVTLVLSHDQAGGQSPAVVGVAPAVTPLVH